MPITALPQNTARALGSGQVLTDSASLVKELIENAIDGRASTISVEVSANTLDDIRVKDNGHGIPPEDRPLACTMHCTSKIRDLDDLQDIGGRSLGFRGVALASAAEMSKCLMISTRIEGEVTAAELKFDRQGQIASEKRASHPIGTTVRAERFLETLPVRRQAVEKTSVKTLARIKSLLQAYALARPNVRLSLKVLKAKTEKTNWKYPKNASVGNSQSSVSHFSAATDVVGKNVTDQCEWVSSTWSTAGERITTTSAATIDGVIEKSFTLEAVLAKHDCDVSVVSNIGCYLSVDSRPVSSARGTMKKIVSIYKSHIRSATACGDDVKIPEPFLYMNIVCPRGSYDANVEPAKDEVLFTNADLVICLAEKYFKAIYGELQNSLPRTAVAKTATKQPGIELLLAKKIPSSVHRSLTSPPSTEILAQRRCLSALPQLEQSITRPETQTSSPTARNLISPAKDQASGSPKSATSFNGIDDQGDAYVNVIPNTMDTHSGYSPETEFGSANIAASGYDNSAWKTSMYANGDNESEDHQSEEDSSSIDEAEENHNLKSIHVSNPWAFAKLNAPFRPPARIHQQNTVDPVHNNQLPTPARQPGDVGNGEAHSSPSPFPFPLKARGSRKAGEAVEPAVAMDRERYEPGSLDTWMRKSLGSTSEVLNESNGQEPGRSDHGPADIDVPYSGPFVSARSLPTGTLLSDIPDISQKPRRKALPQRKQKGTTSRPYIAPVNDPQRVWFETGETRKHTSVQQPHSRQGQQDSDFLIPRDGEDEEINVSGSTPVPASSMHPDLALTMDYETRKQMATQQHRESLRQQARQTGAENAGSIFPRSTPHKNRQTAAIAALHNNEDSHPFPRSDPPIFGPDDPRAYLIRSVQTSETPNQSAQRPKRRKTALLPFETLHKTKYIGNLTHLLNPPNLNLEPLSNAHTHHDEYIHSGLITPAFSPSALDQPEVRAWEQRLKEMVKAQYRLEGMEADEEMDGELDVDLWDLLRRHVEDVACI